MYSRIAQISVLLAFLLFTWMFSESAIAQIPNSVEIESKTVEVNTSIRVGIFVSNYSQLGALVIPLVIRSESGGAFITSATASFNNATGARLHRTEGFLKDGFIRYYPSPNGDCGDGGFKTPGTLDYISPDGVLILPIVNMYAADYLPAGSDYFVLDENLDPIPSVLLDLTINGNPGVIDIDTTCTDPANRLTFAPTDTIVGFTPFFEKGVINVVDQELVGWWPHCGCPDGETDSINSPFGPRRLDNGSYTFHRGLDVKNDHGEDVHAVLTGEVSVSVPDAGYGWQVNLICDGLDATGSKARVTTMYAHLEDFPPPTLQSGDVIQRGSVIYTTGNPQEVGPHIHLEARPNNDGNRRDHPARYLTRNEEGCPSFDPEFDVGNLEDSRYTLEGTSGAYTKLKCRSRSDRDQRYDLVAVYATIYSPTLKQFEVARMHFEKDFQWFRPDQSSRLFFVGTDHEVRVTFDPVPMDRGDPYHFINITVDPTATIPSLEYLGVWLQDISSADCSQDINCRLQASSGGCPSIGNVWGDTPGATIDVFDAKRVANGVLISWLGAPGALPYAIDIYCDEGSGHLRLVNDDPLPIRVEGKADTLRLLDSKEALRNPLKYQLGLVYPNNSVVLLDKVAMVGGYEETPGVMPVTHTLRQNYPNPFNSSTSIQFEIVPPGVRRAEITIYNILGEQVATLFSERDLQPGPYSVTWDGKDKSGVDVASGIYFYRLESDVFSLSKPMVVLK